VSGNVEDGMNILLDLSKPHLALWISLHNTELPSWKIFKRGERPLPRIGTPLHYATICGLHAFVKVLIVEHLHDVDDFENMTPLHMASLRGYEQVARVLLECDADVTAQNDDDQTPLHVASSEGHLQVVRVLLEHGASTTARDKVGSTPLHLALQPRDIDESHVPNTGADSGTEDEDENRLAQLHEALRAEPVSHLFPQGASAHITRDPLERRIHTTAQGSTLLDMELYHAYTGPLFFHSNPVADTMARDKSEWNDLASHDGHVEVAQLLVKHGADPTARNNHGRYPLALASLSGYIEVM
jgi:ankyrin repeat protein